MAGQPLRLVHSGILYPEERDPRPFFAAVRSLKSTGELSAERVRIVLRATASESIRREADRHAFYQYVFFGQWDRLRRHAAERGVGIIGDVPIFVALDSADTWQNRAVFRLDAHGQPLAVAGVPPDYFAATGQLWGNPLYDWDYLAHTGYEWWIDRLSAAFELYDIIRLDHFRGFDTYWEIPAGAPDARGGRWLKGPGRAFFHAVRAALPAARIIAEDLGYIGPDVVELRRAAGLPGMKVLQFAYGHDASRVAAVDVVVISTAINGVPELLTADEGWLVPAGDPAALADAIDLLSQTPNAVLAQMGQSARARALSRHDGDIEAAKLAALFGEYSR